MILPVGEFLFGKVILVACCCKYSTMYLVIDVLPDLSIPSMTINLFDQLMMRKYVLLLIFFLEVKSEHITIKKYRLGENRMHRVKQAFLSSHLLDP